MTRKPSLQRHLAQGAAVGLVAGTAVGLVVVLVLVVVDLVKSLSWNDLLAIVLAYAALGLLVGLPRGLWQARREPVEHLEEKAPPLGHVVSGGQEWWMFLRQGLFQGLGAGLVAGALVGLAEIVALLIVDRSWQPLAGLRYAVIVYGVLGLVSGLGLGLLWGSYRAWRGHGDDSSEGLPWTTFATLIASVGTFLVVHNRVRRDVLNVELFPISLPESLLVDNVLLAAALALAMGLWFLLSRLPGRTRWTQCRWNAIPYLVLVLAIVPISQIPDLIATSSGPDPTVQVPIAAHLRDRPNVIFIMAETFRVDRLGCYVDDSGSSLTPSLDALARDGVLYRDMSVQSSWTRPSVATMLTSLYPSSHRTITQLDLLPDGVTTLPEILHEQGYRTAGFTTNIQTAPRFNFQQGYDQYALLGADPPSFALGTPIAVRFAVIPVFRRLREVIQSPMARPHEEMYQNAASVNQHALSWLKNNQDARFFLFLHYFDPHDPYFAHPYDGTSSIGVPRTPAQVPFLSQLYDSEVSYLDHHLGELFDTLKEWGLYDDLLIVFVSDHGEEFYEHEGFGHANTLYEEVLAVPLIVKYPGGAYAGTVDEELARGLDLAPTVLDVAGVPIPTTMQGVSLRPGAVVTRADSAFAELNYNDNILWSIRTRHRKLIIANEDNRRRLPVESLFDLQTDPREQRNLAQSEPDAVHSLRTVLDQIVAYAQANAVAGQASELDAATRERLKQLGY